MSNAAVEVHKPNQSVTQAAPVSETAAVLSMIERAARDQSVDLDRMERLIDMRERMMAAQRAQEYARDFAAMQAELPIIPERGKGHNNVRYALWEDVNELIKPVLSKHGFSLSFKVTDAENGVEVKAILRHVSGHTDETTKRFAADTSGSKNAIQAIGSSISYGKRYTASALLNLTSRGEDDDGVNAAKAETITEEQVAQIRELLENVGRSEKALLSHIKLEHLSDIRADKFSTVVEMIKRAGGQK